MIRSQILRVFIAILTVAPSGIFAQVDWQGVQLPDSKEVLAYMPGTFELLEDSTQTAIGMLPYTYAYHKDDRANSGNRYYSFSVVTYPEGTFSRYSNREDTSNISLNQEIFETTISEAQQVLSGEVVISQPIGSVVSPGWFFRINYSEDPPRTVHTRAYIVNDRYFIQMQVFSFASDEGIKSRKRFFESADFSGLLARQGPK